MPSTIKNSPNLAGKRAGKSETFGPFSRFAVFPIHTRFDAVTWIVTDAERIDDLGLAAVIRQEPTKALAMAGLSVND